VTAATAVAHLSQCNSFCTSVYPSHGWISQKWCKLDHQIFTVGRLED